MRNFRQFCVLCVVLSGVAFPIWAEELSLDILIRAFIPDVSHAGKGAKHVIDVRGKSVLKFLEQCFEGDNRGFSADYNATSRIGTWFRIIRRESVDDFRVAGLGGSNSNSNKGSWSNPSSVVSCSKGTALHELRPARLRKNEMKAVRRGDAIEISGKLGASNNAVRIGGVPIPDLLVPPIDYEYKIIWNPMSGDVSAEFSHDKFPAYEMYARSGNEPWRMLFRDKPQSGPLGLTGIGGRVDHEPVVLKKMFGQRVERSPQVIAKAGKPFLDDLVAGAKIDPFPHRSSDKTRGMVFTLLKTLIPGVGELVTGQVGVGSQTPPDNSGRKSTVSDLIEKFRLDMTTEGFGPGLFTLDELNRMCAARCGGEGHILNWYYRKNAAACECFDGGVSMEIHAR